MPIRQVGNYRLESLLGVGGMGEVYKAYDTHRDRYVALKLLPAALSGDQEFVKRFQRESNVAARLRDPHVIPIHDFGEIDGQLFIDMRLVDGADIFGMLETYGRITPQRAVYLISQVAEALDAAHADHLVHRDIKPSNILVTLSDFVYVVDFGIARSIDGRQTPLTNTGVTIGTLLYMAPERFTGHDVDGRAIFALLLIAFTVHDLDRPAGVDGYFHVVGRRSVLAGSALAAAAADPGAYTAERLLLSPAAVKGCQVAIGVTMAFILIIMI